MTTITSLPDTVAGRSVVPRNPRGVRDLLPQQMLARLWVFETFRRIDELNGFVPTETPAIECLDVLCGSVGDEAQHSIYHVRTPEGERLGLRFDHTLPLARLVAQYPSLPRPFRRSQVGPVWRFDKPGKGRLRQFYQADIDCVGVESPLGDVEVIAVMCDRLEALGVDRYRARYSSRAALNDLLHFARIDQDRGVDVFRILDKLDKVGLEKVRLELSTGYTDESGDRIRGLGLDTGQIAHIEAFLDIKGESRREVLARLRELFRDVPSAKEHIDTLEQISNHLYALGYDDDRVVIDLSVARGLAYYTGVVFEAVLLDAPQFGSIMGGGRYDDLVLRFSGQRIPATGASIGVDRLMDALEFLGELPHRTATARVLVANMDRSLESAYLAMTWELRRAGIPTELYLGHETSVGKQLKYADKCGVPLVILYGDDEHAHGTITLKNMAAGRNASATTTRNDWKQARWQRSAPRHELVDAVRRMLDEIDPQENHR